MKKVLVLVGRNLEYGFPNHPFSTSRFKEALDEMRKKGILRKKNVAVEKTKVRDEKVLYLFHKKNYVEIVKRLSKIGEGYGFIALQIHSGGGIKVQWRNLEITKL